MRGTVLRLLVAVIILGAFACGGGSSSTSHSLTVSASPVEVERGGRSTITATLEDADGGVGSWIAKFSFRRNESGATLDTIDKVTDINGQVTATYTAGQTPGTDIVEVYFNNAAVATAQIVVAGGQSSQGLIQLTVGGVSGNSFEIVARVFNINGQPVANALVNFTADHGTVSPTTATTDANGYARTTLTTTRSTTVRATSGGASASRNVSISPTVVHRVVLEAFGPALDGEDPIPNTRVIRATVYDNAGRPMPGVKVNFSSNPGSVDPPSQATNANGVAESVLYSAVTANVRATAGGFTAELRVEPL